MREIAIDDSPNNHEGEDKFEFLNEIQQNKHDGEIRSYALILSFFAGFATTIGGCIVVFLISRNNTLNKNNRVRHEHLQKLILGISLSFAAGVMISVSLFDLYLPVLYQVGVFLPTAWLCVGVVLFIVLSKCLDRFLPSLEPSSSQSLLPMLNENEDDRKTKLLRSKNLRIGLLMFISLTLHNFPEGLSVSVASNSSKELGLTIAIAVAIHNIPEGMIVSLPIFISTKSKTKAIGLAFISGMSEPFGALLSNLLLAPLFKEHPHYISLALALVAGIMIAVSVFELLPEAKLILFTNQDDQKFFFIGFFIGLTLMKGSMYFM